MTTALCAPAMRLSAKYSSWVPKFGSVSKLMRSKLPSMVGPNFPSFSDPARLVGPVWIARMPIDESACQSRGFPSAPSTDSPSPVMTDEG